ncbi:MAG: hypothetical protein M3P85_04220 [Actinomycetota bacterium]|nr:hypothetical protein [Actinomycetota bacterium]
MASEEFEEVLCYWSLWDCPRSGVVLMQGEPYHFLCEFSDELDDYPEEFRLWPATNDQLEGELTAWSRWVAWRRRFDRGEAVGPFEGEPEVVAALERLSSGPPTDAIVAIPEWRLDSNRSFAEGVPKHWARWRLSAS